MKQRKPDPDATPEVEPVSPPAARKTIEQWAERHGMLPQFVDGPTVTMSSAGRLNPSFWVFAATKALMNWPEGREVTEDEFLDAVKKQHSVEHR